MSKEEMKLELERIKKQMEKILISTCVAPPSVQTAITKKEVVKSMGQARTDRLKSTGTTYISNFQSSAKGAWVSKVQTTFEQTSTKLTNLTSE